MTPEEIRKAKAELRLARKAYKNAQHTARAASKNMQFATQRLVKAADTLGEIP